MDKKNLEIQSLRGYAIILTVVAHFGTLLPQLNPYLSYFWLGGGVDLFFCISGFVIASILLVKSKDDFFELSIPFFIKRIYRLWPAAFFWSFVVLFFSLVFNNSGAFSTFENNFIVAISGWFQVVNFKIVSCAYYSFTECSGGSPLRLYWSLSLEEQFYFIFPALLYFLGNKKVAVLALVFFVGQFFLYRPWPSPLWFFRTDAICLGILIAWFQLQGYSKFVCPVILEKKVWRSVCSFSLLASLFMVAKSEVVWFYNGLVVLVAGGLVFIASFGKGYFLNDGLMRRALVFIGDRSYSIYLTHMVSFVFVKELFYRFELHSREGYWAICLAVTSLVCILIFSEFSYRIIEQPLRRKGRLIANEKKVEIQAYNNVKSDS
ncbi:MAG: acyltransferase family protein [Methylomarinum sp.]|nr:acyltransferase family protein [Methylomarinum sp.]